MSFRRGATVPRSKRGHGERGGIAAFTRVRPFVGIEPRPDRPVSLRMGLREGAMADNFGGQSLVVELRDEKRLFGDDRSRVPDTDRGGGGELNTVLARALDDSFPYLRYVDPHCNTAFSYLQMQPVLPELRRLQGFTRSDRESRVIARVIELAERCADRVHCYLVFLGD